MKDLSGSGQLRKDGCGCAIPAGSSNEKSAAIAVFRSGDCDGNGPATLQTLNDHTAAQTFPVVFSVIWNDHTRIRDNRIEGTTDAMPTLGEQFRMTAPPRDAGLFRLIETSRVVSIRVEEDYVSNTKKTVFTTENGSIYSVEL